MPHDYKNYAHLEGVIDNDPVVSTMPGGITVTFKLSVKQTRRSENGDLVKYASVFDVEVGKENSRFAMSLKKGTPVWIDANIRIRIVNLNGIDQHVYTLNAHRVYAIDYTAGKKPGSTGAGEIDENCV
jgi:single-stranded DNA-binding protein